MHKKSLADFMAEVVLTSYYLSEPASKQTQPLHDSEVRALKLIFTNGPLSMHELANQMHASKARASQLVGSLIDMGFVERVKGGDKRMIYVVTTPKGAQKVRHLRAKYAKLADAIEQKLGKQDSQELARLLEKISPLHKLSID